MGNYGNNYNLPDLFSTTWQIGLGWEFTVVEVQFK